MGSSTWTSKASLILGYTFQPRRAKRRQGKFLVSFLPAMSAKAAKRVRQPIRKWRMASTRNNQRLEDLARLVNPVVRGWLHHSGRFCRSNARASSVLSTRPPVSGRTGNTSGGDVGRVRRCTGWGASRDRTPRSWSCGNTASSPRLASRSRMRRESHVRFCEGGGVRFPSATRLMKGSTKLPNCPCDRSGGSCTADARLRQRRSCESQTGRGDRPRRSPDWCT
jgi:hypothetical protein